MSRTRTLVIAMLIAVAAVAAAEEKAHIAPERTEAYFETITEFTLANADEAAGSITIGEYRTLLARLSVLQQEADYIRKTAASSFLFPGAGHIANGAAGLGILFGTGELLISAGTLVGAYALLPETVQFGQLNYFTDSFAAIEAQWKNLSFMDVLPSMGVLAAGSLIDMIYRGFVSRNAADLARERIDSGDKEFEPEVGLLLGAAGMPMVGMRHRF